MQESNKTIKVLKEYFDKIDEDKTGLINFDELKIYFERANILLNDVEIAEIIKEVDYFGNHKISLSEFLSATLP
jgi:Ca2+-binding EF-hand superfamily protein